MFLHDSVRSLYLSLKTRVSPRSSVAASKVNMGSHLSGASGFGFTFLLLGFGPVMWIETLVRVRERLTINVDDNVLFLSLGKIYRTDYIYIFIYMCQNEHICVLYTDIHSYIYIYVHSDSSDTTIAIVEELILD